MWADILRGRRPSDFEFIGAKMLVVRLRLLLFRDPKTLAQSCAELRNLLYRNLKLQSVQRDVQKLVLREAPAPDSAISLRTAAEVIRLIKAGKPLLLAGDESLLAQLPRGSWIGGTTPYFVAEDGGTWAPDRVFVNELPSSVVSVEIGRYEAATIERVYEDGASWGFTAMIIPAGSPTHLGFALRAPSFSGFGVRPLVGWISGVHLSDLGRVKPKVFDGKSGTTLGDGAVVMRARLAPGMAAELGIVNIFDQSAGPTIEFERDGFSAVAALIDGKRLPFAAWLKENALDTRLPLVADYLGARVNVSLQSVDPASGEVRFYAPVFAGVKYRHARPVADYAAEFLRRLPEPDGSVAFACNCILNFAALEGRKTGRFTGPVTFGEIAYQLLNQTLAYVTLQDVARR